jgi:hypothetical protein
MATLNEIAYSLLNTARHGRGTNTERISMEQIKYFIINKRSQYIRNELNKNRTVHPDLIQDLGCLDVIPVDRAECCDVETDCFFLRTKEKLPETIELHHEYLITRIGPIDKTSTKFDLVPYERVPFLFNNKFSKNRVRAYMIHDGGYLYLAFDEDNAAAKLIEKINVQGVFEDPREAAKFNTCSGEPCYTDDSKFPIKSWMLSSLETDILNTQLSPAIQTPYDVKSGKQELTVEQKGQAK